jgi:hypothetical protein
MVRGSLCVGLTVCRATTRLPAGESRIGDVARLYAQKSLDDDDHQGQVF